MNSVAFKKKVGVPVDEGLSIREISRLSGMPVRALNEVRDRGFGAYRTNPESVRASVGSPQQWALGRIYSFVMRKKGTFGGADSDIARKYNLS